MTLDFEEYVDEIINMHIEAIQHQLKALILLIDNNLITEIDPDRYLCGTIDLFIELEKEKELEEYRGWLSGLEQQLVDIQDGFITNDENESTYEPIDLLNEIIDSLEEFKKRIEDKLKA